MKKIIGLDQKLKSPNTRTTDDQVPTFRDVFVDSLEFARAANGGEGILLHRLAMKIFDSKESVELENAEFELLKSKVDQNTAGYYAWVHGQSMEKFIEMERPIV